MFALVACTSESPGHAESQGRDSPASSDTDTSLTTEEEEEFDDCTSVSSGERASASRHVLETDEWGTARTTALVSLYSWDEVAAWLDSVGSPTEVTEGIDFDTQQAVGLVSQYGRSSNEGDWIDSFEWSADEVVLYAVIRVNEPCMRADDSHPLIQLWGVPKGVVGVCERGIRCARSR